MSLIATLAVSACASSPAGGIATYDALKQAQDKCAAKGGTLTLKSGGDTQYIDDYACKRN